MFIAVSGMAGAGKTTLSNSIVHSLRTAGCKASSWRFQTLPCFALLRRSLRPDRPRDSGGKGSGGTTAAVRWSGYRRKRLTAVVALVYFARILAFRAYMLLWRSSEWRVLNRYFYDSFVHLQLTTRTERLYYAVLRSVVPVPDVAILVEAELETVAVRRPDYAHDYLTEVAAAYGRLKADFPSLIEIRTDPGELSLKQMEAVLAERLNSRMR